MMRWIPTVTMTALAGCYSPSYTSCAVTCATSNNCPSGLECVGGVCIGPGESCSTPTDDAPRDTSGADARLAPWGVPTQVVFGNFPLATSVDDPTLRADMLEMLFNVGGTDIYRSTRPSVMDAWEMPTLVSELDTNTNVGSPDLSPDGLQLVFSDEAGGNAGIRITRRNTTSGVNGVFMPPTLVMELDSTLAEGSPAFSSDTLTLVFHSTRGGTEDLWLSTRPDALPSTDWTTPIALTSLNGPSSDDSPCLSADGLTIYFSSIRGGATLRDLYMATRDSTSKDFSNIVPITELNTDQSDSDPWVSPDGRHMYFARSTTSGSVSIWHSAR
jgi:Tol biopolymer transport system component